MKKAHRDEVNSRILYCRSTAGALITVTIIHGQPDFLRRLHASLYSYHSFMLRASVSKHYGTSKGWAVSAARGIHRRNLLTLAIETSCDDTAVAVLEKHASTSTLR